MKRVICLFVYLCLVTLVANSQEWQTWSGKGLLVNNWEDSAPADDANGNHWYSENFDDSNWSAVQIPIESFQEYGAYYVRTSFTLPEDYEEYEWVMSLATDDGCKIYLNDQLVYEESNRQDKKITLDKSLLKKQNNIIAAVVYDSGGGNQYLKFNIRHSINGLLFETYDNLSATVSGYTNIASDLAIPETVTLDGKDYSVQGIGKFVFMNCTDITSVSIPRTIGRFDEGCFEGCTSLTDVTVYFDNPSSPSLYYPFRYVNQKNATLHVPSGMVEQYAILNDVWGAFGTITDGTNELHPNFEVDGFTYHITDFNNHEVELSYSIEGAAGYSGDIEVPGTVSYNETLYTITAIGNGTFDNDEITSIIIPNTVTSVKIGECRGLKSISLPNSVTYIEGFNYCSSLESIRIPNSVQEIGPWSFLACDKLKSITFEENSQLQSIGRFGGGSFDHSALQTINIPKSVKTIYGFTYCPSLSSVIFEEGSQLQSISGFSDCSALQTIIIPKSVKTISGFGNCSLSSVNFEEGSQLEGFGQWAFGNNPNLKSIDLPKSLVYMHNCAFGNTGLTSIKIGSSFKSIGENVFIGCDIESICVDENNTMLDSRNNCNAIIETATNRLIFGCKNTIIPNTVNIIGSNAFWDHGCINLENIEIPSSVKSIEYGAFNGTGLKSIVVPNSVESIGQFAFCGCKNLTSMTLGKAIRNISWWAFCDNPVLKEVVNYSPIPVEGPSDIFDNSSINSAVLYIPNGSKELYEQSETWKNFGTIKEINFYAGDKEANFGKQMVLPIYLNNDESVCGFQFDIELPEGFSIATSGRKATYVISAGAERFAGLDHTVTSQLQSDGSVRVLCSSITNANINDDCKDAPVINITINVDASVAPADYMVKLKNITLARFVDAPIEVNLPDAYSTITVLNAFPVTATSSNNAWGTAEITGDNYDSETGNAVIGTDVTLTATAANGFAFVNWTENNEEVSAENPLTFTVNEARNLVAVFTMLGDVYENNVVNVTDLSATVGIILNRTTPTRREYVAANIDNDDKIDVADYSNIAAIILNGGVSAAKSEDFTKYVINMQYDMHIPAGLKMNADEIAVALRQTALAKNHSIVTRELDNGDIRVLVLSMQNDEIADAKAMLEEIAIPATKATGEYNITLSNIILAYNDLSKEEVSMMNQKLMLTAPTGIDLAPIFTEGEGTSYNLNGQKLQKAKNGINIIEGKKYIIK